MIEYHEGFQEAQDAIRKMNKDELMKYLYLTYGTEVLNLKFAVPTDEQIREEALRQCRKDFEIRPTT